jgi:hypothetical protein
MLAVARADRPHGPRGDVERSPSSPIDRIATTGSSGPSFARVHYERSWGRAEGTWLGKTNHSPRLAKRAMSAGFASTSSG